MRKHSFVIISLLAHVAFSQTSEYMSSSDSMIQQQPPQTDAYKVNNINDVRLGDRDPFNPPKYIRDMEQVNPADIIDSKMEAIRRWPLWDYKLRGIIWDVKNPKAIIVDKMNTLHLLKKNYRLGNREGLISEINESEIVVIQKGIPTVMQIETSLGSGADVEGKKAMSTAAEAAQNQHEKPIPKQPPASPAPGQLPVNPLPGVNK
jgi:Tfp pilus assembly protein PilP